VMQIRDQDYGSRDFICRDPEGHLWSLGTYTCTWSRRRASRSRAGTDRSASARRARASSTIAARWPRSWASPRTTSTWS
jgi:hypothetical protein